MRNAQVANGKTTSTRLKKRQAAVPWPLCQLLSLLFAHTAWAQALPHADHVEVSRPDNLLTSPELVPAAASPSEDTGQAVQDPPGGGSLLASQALTLADVSASVSRSFPLLQQARLQAGVAGGNALSANGFYDHKLEGYTLSKPTGVYRNYRQGLGVARQLWWGGYLSAGYRIGRGDFEPWYKERETDEGGEFKLAIIQPLLKGRAIDPARVALFQANLQRQAVGPEVAQVWLEACRSAATYYWSWVAAGRALDAQRQLLELAEARTAQLKSLVESGKNKAIDLIFNEQLVAERRLKVIETEQKFRESAYQLSLFLRQEDGSTLLPPDDWVPARFPTIPPLPPGDYTQDLADALRQRPELRTLSLDVQFVNIDLRLARNQLLPQLDFVSEGSQDAGEPASIANDKSRFELEIGLQGEVPIQRRQARGKVMANQAKLAQLQQKIRYQQDKIGVELQMARNALDLAAQSVNQAQAALRSAILSLERYTFAFTQGQVDLVFLNLLESKTNEYEIKLIESQSKWFTALASMQAALGLDPVDQAVQISDLSATERP